MRGLLSVGACKPRMHSEPSWAASVNIYSTVGHLDMGYPRVGELASRHQMGWGWPGQLPTWTMYENMGGLLSTSILREQLKGSDRQPACPVPIPEQRCLTRGSQVQA